MGERFKREGIYVYLWFTWGASLVAQRVKHLPVMREIWVWSLGREDPLEKEKATHSGTFAWKIPWMEKPGRLQSIGWQRVGYDWATSLSWLIHVEVWHKTKVCKAVILQLKNKLKKEGSQNWDPGDAATTHPPTPMVIAEEPGMEEARWRKKQGLALDSWGV